MAEQRRAPNPFLRDKNKAVLDMFTIYDHPKDYPDKFVVRRWFVIDQEERPATEHACQLADTLEAARLLVPPGYYRTARMPEDDPVIVETWM